MTLRFLIIQLLGLSMLVGLSLQKSTPESSTYVAAVIEYHPNDTDTDPKDSFDTNTGEFLRLMMEINKSDVDIIVFPESCLNTPLTAVPEIMDGTNLCTSRYANSNIQDLACYARTHKIYVVINLYTKKLKPHSYVYNTNVVFDRNGTVISTHRKIHLLEEKGVSVPNFADNSTFSTDFNVTFGHLISAEIMFSSPGLNYILQGVDNIIFPTKWYSELPFLTAVQLQQNWAYVNNVNVLAAGVNNPSIGCSGSGIYSGRSGALVSLMTGANGTKVLIHEVPKKPGTAVRTNSSVNGSDIDNLKLKQDQIEKYKLKAIKMPKELNKILNDSFTLCHNTSKSELCCSFEIGVTLQSVAKSSVSYTYMAAVYSGEKRFQNTNIGPIQTCAILACKNGTACGLRHNETKTGIVDSNISFEKIVIRGNFSKDYEFTMPNTLGFDLVPYPSTDFTYEEAKNKKLPNKNVTISLLKTKADLFTFAIYGRKFRNQPASGNRVASTIVMLLTVLVFKFAV